MARNNLVASLLTLPLAIACEMALFSGLSAQASQPVLPTAPSTAKPIQISQSFKPPRRGTPSITAGGATRSNGCLTRDQSLRAILPKENWGLTVSGRPTFLIYVPAATAKSAEFVIKDAQDNDIYRTMLPLKQDKAQLVALRLPESAPELQVGQEYLWYFSVVCRPNNRLEDLFVRALVQRVEPDVQLNSQLKQVKGNELANVYANAGIWYDSLATLLDLRMKNPNSRDVNTSWMSLLRSVGLEQFGNNPVLQAVPADMPMSATK